MRINLSEKGSYKAPRLLHPAFVKYDMYVKNICNPLNKPKVGIYLAAGTDISNFLLSTNATEAYFIDQYQFKRDSFIGSPNEFHDKNCTYAEMFDFKFHKGYSNLGLAVKYGWGIFSELSFLGISSYYLSHTRSGDPRIKFQWIYPGTSKPRQYTITFLQGDLRNKAWYRKLQDIGLSGRVELCYQHAAFNLPALCGSYYYDAEDFFFPYGREGDHEKSIKARACKKKVTEDNYPVDKSIQDLGWHIYMGEIIAMPDLYEQIISKGRSITFDNTLEQLLEETREYRSKPRPQLIYYQMGRIMELNRALCQKVYDCPPIREDDNPQKDNYIKLARALMKPKGFFVTDDNYCVEPINEDVTLPEEHVIKHRHFPVPAIEIPVPDVVTQAAYNYVSSQPDQLKDYPSLYIGKNIDYGWHTTVRQIY